MPDFELKIDSFNGRSIQSNTNNKELTDRILLRLYQEQNRRSEGVL